MVEALHRVLQSGGANGAIGRGMLSGHQGIHSAVAENKQHPLSNRLRGNGGDLLPVSYTHLDVYKRQLQQAAGGAQAARGVFDAEADQIAGAELQV